jgi:DNA-binding transcriptional MerR regulator
MAASVLSTGRAVGMSVFVIRAFVAIRQAVVQHEQLSKRLELLEQHLTEHDSKIRALVEAIRELMAPSKVPKIRQIGFRREEP